MVRRVGVPAPRRHRRAPTPTRAGGRRSSIRRHAARGGQGSVIRRSNRRPGHPRACSGDSRSRMTRCRPRGSSTSAHRRSRHAGEDPRRPQFVDPALRRLRCGLPVVRSGGAVLGQPRVGPARRGSPAGDALRRAGQGLLGAQGELAREEQARLAVRARVRDMKFDWATLLVRGMEQGAIPEADPRLLVRTILGLYGSIWTWFPSSDSPGLPSVSAFHVDRVLRAVCLDPQPAACPAPV